MKKSILIFFSVFFCLNFYSQIITNLRAVDIKGYYPITGYTYEYEVNIFNNNWDVVQSVALFVDVKSGVVASNSKSHCAFNVDTKGAKPASTTKYKFKVKWDDVEAKGSITLRLSSQYDNYPHEYSFTIEKPKVKISGPTTIKYGSTVTYIMSTNINFNPYMCQWAVSSDLQIVGTSNNGSVSIKVITNEPKDLKNAIKVVARESNGTELVGFVENLKIEPVYIVESDKKYACLNENISYSIKDLPSMASVSWQAISNVSLVSGQGTKAATFKATGNGEIKVKAIVTCNGKQYTVENNKASVGSPAKGSSFIVGNEVLVSGQTGYYYISGVPIGVEDYYSDYTWSLSSDYAFFPDFINYGTSVHVKGSLGIILPYPPHFPKRNKILFPTDPEDDQFPAALVSLSVSARNRCGSAEIGWTSITIVAKASGSGSDSDSDSGSGPGSRPGPLLNSSPSFQKTEEYSIKVYAYPSGKIVYEEQKVLDFNIENTTLRKGIYIIWKTDQSGNVTKKKVKKN